MRPAYLHQLVYVFCPINGPWGSQVKISTLCQAFYATGFTALKMFLVLLMKDYNTHQSIRDLLKNC